MKNSLVSIIIPVYNVEKYLNQCLESVANQTYKNLEIIIVYDESFDNTLKICKQWKEKDDRVDLIINKMRCGLGMARNLGLSQCEGEYIIYLDSDDWLKDDFIEKMYKEISTTNADYVSSRGFYDVSKNSITTNHSVPAGYYCDAELKNALLITDSVCVWKKIYSKKWIDDNKILNPPLFYYEDWGMYPTVIRQSRKVKVIDEVGVYYRHFREGCLSNDFVSKDMLSNFEKAIKYIIHYLEYYKLSRKKDKYLAYYCIRDYYYRLGYAKKLENVEALHLLAGIKVNVLEKEFGEFDFEKYRYIALGGFSLRWQVHKAIFNSENLNKHYCFSSIISVMAKCPPIQLKHENAFRREKIKADVDSEFLDEIKKFGDTGFVFIDFLEERYNLMEIEKGKYITQSDAFLESEIEEELSFKKIIKWGSEEYMILWKESCQKFISYLKKYLKKSQIIYVANRMALCYGDFEKTNKYEHWETVLGINKVLSEMETYFLKYFSGITVVYPKDKAAFTDKNFRMGLEPQYMNNIYYSLTGVEIFSKIMKWE